MIVLSRNRKEMMYFLSITTALLLMMSLYYLEKYEHDQQLAATAAEATKWKLKYDELKKRETMLQEKLKASKDNAISIEKDKQIKIDIPVSFNPKDNAISIEKDKQIKIDIPVSFNPKDIRDLKSSTPSNWFSVEMSAYTANCAEGCTGITATGYDVRDSSKDYGVIAVDPSIIPLHSIVEIEGVGIYKALDKGGAIKGHKIDVLMKTHRSAIEFGRKNGKIRYIRKGGSS